jgi:hypothetical protein
MGITVAYRGTLRDLTRLEDLEDRVVDLGLEVGAYASIWRSQSRTTPARVVRGVLLDLAPGLETVSLLVSPEGFFVPLTAIEDAEEGRLTEPPWVFVKTQLGPAAGHVLLVELLRELEACSFARLEVRDEGGYFETRSLEELERRRGAHAFTLDGLEAALGAKAPFRDDSADAAALATRVQRVLARPSEHAPFRFAEPSGDGEDELEGQSSEAEWDAFHRDRLRALERFGRAVEEQRMSGEPRAVEKALLSEGLVDLPGDEELTAGEDGFWFDDPEEEAWRESVTEPFWQSDPADHPLVERAMDLVTRVCDVTKPAPREAEGLVGPAQKGAFEMMGGVVQAMTDRDPPGPHGHRLVQLKRALRGAALLRGALFWVLAEKIAVKETLGPIFDEIGAIEDELQAEVGSLRARL